MANSTSKGLTSEADSHVKMADRLARESLKEARRSVRALRPQELEDRTLVAAMAALIGKMTDGTEVRSQVVVNGIVHVLGSDKVAIEKAIAQTRRNPGALALPVTMTVGDGKVTVNVPAAQSELRRRNLLSLPGR